MKRIAIDMDEVMADFSSKHLSQFNAKFQDSLTLEDLQGTRLRHLRPHLADEITAIIDEVNFFRDLNVVEGCQEVIRELSSNYEIYIATAAMEHPSSLQGKYEWLCEHFSFISPMNYVFCGDKSIINADYLIDDNVRNFKGFRGQGLLFTAPHNRDETGYVRVNSWAEVLEYFRSQSH
ncbi:5'(3')-deoxyribonucleotidase [Paenibacillus cellulosilyticus]|uniref:5'(3')-deoxyribonucleotidase n=1 Tax=Paenibacillus cellulosilyticus TaxID=375489 RepID=A0A2V2YH46_9BACL|nr:5'-3'-deoxyribonucleotidase [Paenibacillus cellulosilyticus]PWV90983.1 5'(3')-deoxyribonucleotidase [Paenibacillus cellulosilyticus]QKS45200.1 5'-3'-deoxyribonucleotidase [Paenibacillus cellulosilyticus]